MGSGQRDYYRYREGTAAQVDPALLEHLSDWEAFDQTGDEIAEGQLAEAQLLIEGIHCSACAWLIESQLKALPGIAQVEVDSISREAVVRWNPQRTGLGESLKRLVQLGYRPHPVSPGQRLASVARGPVSSLVEDAEAQFAPRAPIDDGDPVKGLLDDNSIAA